MELGQSKRNYPRQEEKEMRRFELVWWVASLFLFGVFVHEIAHSEVYRLDLARIVVIDGDGIVQDSGVENPRAQGSLRIDTDARNIVRGLEGEAWFRGADQPVWDDWVLTLDYTLNGARYELMSLWTNDQYYVTFLRRAPPNDFFDPATIMMIELEDTTIVLDYRYE